MTECVFCTAEVQKEGATCSVDCYASWYAWAMTLTNGKNDSLCKLQPDERYPLPFYDQPWYGDVTNLEDYL